jgi:hypothetical protein
MRDLARLRITIAVDVTTDRDGWEYGEHLARFVAGEINEDSASEDARARGECLDVEKIPVTDAK